MYQPYKVPSNSPAFYNRIVKRIPGELKGMDTDIGIAGVLSTTNTNGNVICLNLVQQGSGSWNRVGRKTHLKSISLSGYASCLMQQSNGDWVGNQLRMLLVWDKQPSGNALPTFDTIFGDTDQTGAEATTVWSPPKFDNMDRFVVLKEWREVYTPQGSVFQNLDTHLVYKPIKCYLPLNQLESVYSGQSNPMTISDISTGALYFVARAVNNDVNTSACTIVGKARLRYSD